MKTWADQWLIKFSVEKTKSMFVRYQGNNHDLDNVSEYKHLGVIIQYNPNWNSHIGYICKKASKRLGILNSVSHKLSRKSLETMYFSYVRSILEYADILFCNTSQENLKQMDITIQKRVGEIVSGANRCTSSDALYEELSRQRLSDRRQNRMIILYSDIIHHRAPSYLFSTHSRNCRKQSTIPLSPEKPLKFIMPYIQSRNIQKIILSFYDFILERSGKKYKTKTATENAPNKTLTNM